MSGIISNQIVLLFCQTKQMNTEGSVFRYWSSSVPIVARQMSENKDTKKDRKRRNGDEAERKCGVRGKTRPKFHSSTSTFSSAKTSRLSFEDANWRPKSSSATE